MTKGNSFGAFILHGQKCEFMESFCCLATAVDQNSLPLVYGQKDVNVASIVTTTTTRIHFLSCVNDT